MSGLMHCWHRSTGIGYTVLAEFLVCCTADTGYALLAQCLVCWYRSTGMGYTLRQLSVRVHWHRLCPVGRVSGLAQLAWATLCWPSIRVHAPVLQGILIPQSACSAYPVHAAPRALMSVHTSQALAIGWTRENTAHTKPTLKDRMWLLK